MLGAIVVFVLLTRLLNLPTRAAGSGTTVVEERKVLVEVFKAALGLAAGLGAVVALTLNYRRHRIEVSQSHRDDQRLFTERFRPPPSSSATSSPPYALPASTHLRGSPMTGKSSARPASMSSAPKRS